MKLRFVENLSSINTKKIHSTITSNTWDRKRFFLYLHDLDSKDIWTQDQHGHWFVDFCYFPTSRYHLEEESDDMSYSLPPEKLIKTCIILIIHYTKSSQYPPHCQLQFNAEKFLPTVLKKLGNSLQEVFLVIIHITYK